MAGSFCSVHAVLRRGRRPVVLKRYGRLSAAGPMTAERAAELAADESLFMRDLDRRGGPRCLVIADVSGVGLGLAFWRYARAIVDAPKWRLPAHTYVVNAPLWARGAWRVLSGWLSGADVASTTLHRGGIEEAFGAALADRSFVGPEVTPPCPAAPSASPRAAAARPTSSPGASTPETA